jgi:anti-anti-sigma regulatory factor
MDVETLQAVEPCILRLDGSWTIERAQELKSMLVAALAGNNHVIIDVGGVTEVDLSFLQLLCSAHRASLKGYKYFALHENQSAAFKRVVHDAGYVRTLGCHQDPERSCLWKGSEVR